MRVVFDIETELFTNRFRKARSISIRRQLAPKPRLVCAYVVETKKYHFYSGKNIPNVIPLLKKAREIITYNGENFDFLVLERHCGLVRSAGFHARSIDMYQVLTQLNPRFRISLDRAAKLNFCVGKKAKGKVLGVARIETLKRGARSDVKQTFMLYTSWRDQNLMFPVKPERDLPPRCPECDSKVELIPFQPDYAGMTEGQIFDYELGHQHGAWGYARCIKCKKFIVWGI